MDVDRYITDGAVSAMWAAEKSNSDLEQPRMVHMLRAALPHIIPLVRADILTELFTGNHPRNTP